MLYMWKDYIEKTKMIFFVVDSSNYQNISIAVVEFLNIFNVL